LSDAESEKISLTCQANLPQAESRFEFQKRTELFIGAHNEAPPIAAMRVSNPNCSPLKIRG
jgi:hypothetical protein